RSPRSPRRASRSRRPSLAGRARPAPPSRPAPGFFSPWPPALLEYRRLAVDPVGFPECVGDFAERRVRPDGVEHVRDEILVAQARVAEGAHGAFPARRVAARPQRTHALDLAPLDLRIDLENGNGNLVLAAEAVDPDDDPAALLDLHLEPVGRIRDLLLWESPLHGLDDPAHLVDAPDDAGSLLLHPIGEGFEEIGARKGVDHVRDARFVGDDLLR